MRAEPILLAVDGMAMGGTEQQVLQLIRGLERRGRFKVVLALLDRGGELDSAAITAATAVLPVLRRARFDVAPALSIALHARRTGIHLIHAVGWLSGMAGLAAARALGVPVINGSVRSAPSRLGRNDRVSRWCAGHSDWIVANSHAGLRAYGLSDHPRTQVIANAFDSARLDGVSRVAAEQPTICMVANFSGWKDHATVIRALPRILHIVPACKLLLVGIDRGTLGANRQLAEALGLGRAVEFVTGELRPERVIASSRVGVLSSPSESFSNAILEYMALGKPVVATDTCGDAGALLLEGRSGVLVPYGSSDQLADAVIGLLLDPARAAAMGEAGRRQSQGFTVERMLSSYEELYDRLLTQRR